MADGWIHSIIDLIAYGRPYFYIHRFKNETSKKLGWTHRIINHEWYQKFGKEWDFENPFPYFLKDIHNIKYLAGMYSGNSRRTNGILGS